MIAISYRRQDSSPVAGRLYDRLQAEFGKGSVFMDFDSIPYGVDFREHIKQTLQRAKVVVAIIGPEWTGGKDPSNRRIDDPTDFVRLEVASALENGIPIIPVLVDNTPMPDAKNLPPGLEGLAFRNGLALDTGIDFHHHADRLIAGIRRVLSPSDTSASATTSMRATAAKRAGGKGMAIAALIALLLGAGAFAAWYFLGRAPRPTLTTREAAVTPAMPVATPVVNSSPTPAPTIATAAPSPTIATAEVTEPSPAASLAVLGSRKPPTAIVDPSKSSVPKPPADEPGHEYTYSGIIGRTAATFRLRFDAAGHVTGTYSQNGKTYRLEGQNPKGKVLLYEYTGEEKTARLDLTLQESGAEVRWEGTMYNISPNTNTYPVSFRRPRK